MEYNEQPYTKCPNDLIDDHMPDMSMAELKVVMVVLRKTVGWQKPKDVISLSQFVDATGLTRKPVTKGISDAIDRGVLCRERSGQSFRYWISSSGESPPVEKVHQWSNSTGSSGESPPEVVENLHPQKKKKEKKETTPPPAHTREDSDPSSDFDPVAYLEDRWQLEISDMQAEDLRHTVTGDYDLWKRVVDRFRRQDKAKRHMLHYALEDYQNPGPQDLPDDPSTNTPQTNGTPLEERDPQSLTPEELRQNPSAAKRRAFAILAEDS